MGCGRHKCIEYRYLIHLSMYDQNWKNWNGLPENDGIDAARCGSMSPSQWCYFRRFPVDHRVFRRGRILYPPCTPLYTLTPPFSSRSTAYLRKLGEKFAGKYVERSMPYRRGKEIFDRLVGPATENDSVDRTSFLQIMGALAHGLLI